MCGINGFNWKDKNLIENMNKAIIHRGPDYQGIKLFDNLSLGHDRLSIIDLSEKGHQPMHNRLKDVFIVFNGEIYNYKELKEKYCRDYEFSSKTDTEVILAMYQKFGENCVDYFNGMWAFCIYDSNREVLFCSRDRLGIKPFYYYNENDKFIFSSEVKAILENSIKLEINPRAISSFLSYRYVIEEETFFKEIKKLKPGYSLIYDLETNKITIKEYWDLNQNEIIDSFNSQKEQIEQTLQKCVNYRMVADVEVGAILSGGLDSSLTSAIMAKLNKDPINTYTVKFQEEGFDETPFAKLVAEQYHTNHNELLIEHEDYIKWMNEYLKYKDEPVGVPNEVALFLLYKQIKKTATVVLAGEGADEIFGGYGRIFRSPFDYLKKTIEKNNINFLDFFLNIYGYFSDEDLKYFLKEEFYYNFSEVFKKYMENCPRDYYDKISYIFLKLHLPGLLLRSDSSSMASAVESRVPFLDHELVQSVYSLPFEFKNKFKTISDLKESVDLTYNEISENKDIPKYMLKEIAKNYLHADIINRKKKGFPLPLNKWFGENSLKKMKNILLANDGIIKNYANINNLENWINKNGDDAMFGQKLWMLYSLEIWLQFINLHYSNIIF
jgi:asparagine synthase (glutamine-hydrolysing)